ncbi:MAG: hypothetical protein KDK00_03340 [Rhodobacteraceae bacterium]|nr:hypothetical protein [Paracoccaceae bacterium]
MTKTMIAVAAAAMLALPVAASAKQCHGTAYEGSNAPILTGRYQDVAKDAAVISWGTAVSVSLGIRYANWENAVDKGFTCEKRGRLYKCYARARPCRP